MTFLTRLLHVQYCGREKPSVKHARAFICRKAKAS